MRAKLKKKPIVAVLLPIFFLLVVVLSIYQWNPLKADDQNTHMLDVKINGKKIDSNYSVNEEYALLEVSAEKAQVLKFLGSDKYDVISINEQGKKLPIKEITSEELPQYLDIVEKITKSDTKRIETTEQSVSLSSESTIETSTLKEIEAIDSQLFYVVEKDKKIPYLLVDEDQTIWLHVTKKSAKDVVNIEVEESITDKKQSLFQFNSASNKEETESSKVSTYPSSSKEQSNKTSETQGIPTEKSTTSNSIEKSISSTNPSSKKNETKKSISRSKTEKQTNEEKKRNLAIEQLLEETYEERDSFKPIELPFEEASRPDTKESSSPISITGAKVKIQTGTDYIDPGNDNPGYDSSFENDRVRSFDSIIYLLTFSIESNDPTTTYSDIKYRVDMELPEAYSLDESGKQRFNAEVVDNENGELIDTSPTTKLSKGHVESMISGNGQILLPMFVNVYGAQNNTIIAPTMKVTVISAKNNKTNKIETVNKTYDQTNMSDSLKLKETRVSAKPSIKPSITKGARKPITDLVSGVTGVDAEWDIFGVGVTLGLKSIDSRASADFRGATFPNGEIKIKISSENFYQTSTGDVKSPVSASESGSLTTQTRPIYAIASSVATGEITGWKKHLYTSSTLNIPKDILTIGVPKGKTGKIYTTEPNVSNEDKKQIGVYDTGNLNVDNSGLSMTVSNSDYEPIYNPYTYTLTGNKTNDNEKIFSSSMMIVQWSKSYLLNKGTGIFSTDLKISSISYEGQTQATSEKTSVSDAMLPDGAAVNVATFTKNANGRHPELGLSSTGSWANSAGDGTVGQGESNIYFGGASIDYITAVREVQKIIRWNANSFEYDLSREVYSQSAGGAGYNETKTRYGVGKIQNHPALSVSSKSDLESQYNWYSSPEEAVTHGKISAVKFFYSKVGDSFGDWSGAPVKVVGKAGAFDESGNPNIGLSNSYWYSAKGELLAQDAADGHKYVPTIFDSSGNSITNHNSWHGDSIFIKPFRIETTTKPEKPTYKTNEIVDWNVKGHILTNTNTNYGVKLTSTLPAGLKYEFGSSVDGHGEALSEPTVVNNSNGTTTLIWNFSNINPSASDSVEVKFKTRPSLKELTFNSSALATATVNTVGDIWLESNPNQKDTSKEALRASSGTIQLYQMQQIILTKEVDKNFIEVGTKDPANTALSNDITYRVTLENYSSDKLLGVNILDVLPYNGDSYGSNFSGSYTVKNIKVVEGTGEITYTNNIVSETTDPNNIYGWGLYVPGKSNPTTVKNAKGFLVSTDELAVDDKLAFEVTISPNGQNSGDIYRNRASFNSQIELPVSSNIVQTQVLGRNLSGYVWYDDDYDGLMEKEADGSLKKPAENIPVKLYRTSQVKGSYVEQLVEESLTGEPFIDGSKDSLIKTDAKGKYEFKNLPEGEYIAEFMVGDLVVQKYVIVTKQLVGSDKTLNSKADPSDYKTPEYNQPELKDLPTLLTGTDKVHHVTDVNAGLTPLSTIRLFKYEKGTVIDSDGDGKLSDAEIEATGKPLANAEFNIYKGNSTNPADQIGDGKTNSQGWIRPEFTGLPPGDYTFVETKAPDGFELLKEPIKVTIPTYNYIATLHVSDDSQTKLPFTGGTKAMRIILIASAALFVIGMTGVFLHFRPIKVRGGK